jgi:uncharacterized protein (DUF1330 family)
MSNEPWGGTMAVYLMGSIEVVDSAGYEEYRRRVPSTIAEHGGRYLARGGATEVLDGTWLSQRCVIVEFPDMEKFKAWWSSPEYLSLRAIRERTARSQLVVTEGL